MRACPRLWRGRRSKPASPATSRSPRCRRGSRRSAIATKTSTGIRALSMLCSSYRRGRGPTASGMRPGLRTTGSSRARLPRVSPSRRRRTAESVGRGRGHRCPAAAKTFSSSKAGVTSSSIVAAGGWLLVGSPSQENRRVPETVTLHVVVLHFADALDAHGFPGRILAGAPSALGPGHAGQLGASRRPNPAKGDLRAPALVEERARRPAVSVWPIVKDEVTPTCCSPPCSS